MIYNGYNITVSNLLTKTEHIPIAKSRLTKINDIVMSWNPCNNYFNPDLKVVQVPDLRLIVQGRSITMHPIVFKEFKKQIGE